MWDVILDAVLDTLKILPLLLAVYILIEVLESGATTRMKLNKVLCGGLAPLIGGTVGLIPQCGFSVVATNLYSKKSIKLGTLLAVFIATSDEAIPVILSNPGAALKLLPLLALKLVFAVGTGYLINFLTRNRITPLVTAPTVQEVTHGCHGHIIPLNNEDTVPAEIHGIANIAANNAINDAANDTANYTAKDTANSAANNSHKEKHNSEIGKESKLDRYLIHPILHTLTVLAFILAVNLILGIILYFVGEARLKSALESARYFQPFIAAAVGLIPNCASSVVISQLYASGALTMGAAFAGLCVNAGLGFAVLFKQNKNLKENVLILIGMYLGSSIVGLALSFLPL